jgi:transcriptional regulator with XRE-family HTH domain
MGMDWKFVPGRIKIAREVNDVSQVELARRIGVQQQQISQWENGEIAPGQDSLTKICNALGTPPKFFFVQSGNDGNITGNEE